ncbi:MAG TPA: hypothetical protein PKE64_11905 [Anaerolineae bacterium]|nr:hypothetical protein [Anaerolineae bacterium]HMR64702.1 hypothetical protein [Anaerolineae bacterium]
MATRKTEYNASNRSPDVRVYEADNDEAVIERSEVAPGYAATSARNVMVTTPIDRIRWGSVIAGLFTALSALVVLNILGLAIGLSSYDIGDTMSNFGLGAGIWGAISTLIAFMIGGWLAARTAAAPGSGNGILNGVMVWVVTIPLLLYLLGSGISSLLNTVGNLAATSTEAIAPVAEQVLPVDLSDPATQATVQAGGQDAAAQVQATATAVAAQGPPQEMQQIPETAATSAWGTLLALLLGLGAAALGGWLGARPVPARMRLERA